MNLKQKLRSYNFWVSIASAILLCLRVFSPQLGFEIDSAKFMDAVTALCTVLVVFGIIVMPSSKVKAQTEEVHEGAEETVLDENPEAILPILSPETESSENSTIPNSVGGFDELIALFAENKEYFQQFMDKLQQNDILKELD